MRYGRLVFLLPFLALGACDDDGVSVQTPDPAALVRFVNAIVDTGTVDLRFVDNVENLPTLQGVSFRSYSGMYQRVIPGSRHARVFPNSPNIQLTSTILVDNPSLGLSVDTRYTLVYAGSAQDGSDQLAVIQDDITPPTPPAGNIAFQALHVAAGTGEVDVYVVPVASATAGTPSDWQTVNAAVLRNVSYLDKAAAYVNVPVRPSGGFYRFVVTAAGSTTPLFAATPNLPGSQPPAGATYGPQPGVQIAGSVLTAVVAPGAMPGTRSATSSNQTRTVFLMIDKVLNP